MISLVEIRVNCIAPKRLAGEYVFNSFTELCEWMFRSFKRPKTLAGSVLVALSERGAYSRYTAWCSLNVSSNITVEYFEHRRMAREAGILRHKRRRFEEEWDFKNEENILEFAKLLDEKVKTEK